MSRIVQLSASNNGKDGKDGKDGTNGIDCIPIVIPYGDFSGRSGTALTVNIGGVVPLNTSNVNSGFNFTSNQLRIITPGIYQITANITNATATGFLSTITAGAGISINGNTILSSEFILSQPTASTSFNGYMQAITPCNANDLIEITNIYSIMILPVVLQQTFLSLNIKQIA